MNNADESSGWHTVALWLLLVVALVLRLHGLDSQLWLDEIFALMSSIRRPAVEIMSHWPGPASHIFPELLSHASLRIFGETAFAIRLPAVLFGTAGVAAIFVLAKRMFSPTHALVAAGLLAVSYHHVFYSQNARGYPALIFFYLVASHLFVRFVETGRVSRGAGASYVAAVTLAVYSQPFGVFIPAAHVLVALVRSVRPMAGPAAPRFPLAAYLRWTGAAALVTLALYAPFFGSMMGHALMNVATPVEGPRLGFGLIVEVVEGLSVAFFGPVGLACAAAAGLAGLIGWWRHNAVSVLVLLLPVVIQVAVFVPIGFGIHPRYFAIILPSLFLTATCALVSSIRWLTVRIPIMRAWPALATASLLAVVVVASAAPLAQYYRYPKQDFKGALEIVGERAMTGDVQVGIQVAGSVLVDYYGANFVRVDTLGELLAIERQGHPIWLVTTLERILKAGDAGLYDHIKAHYTLVNSLYGTVGDGSVHVYERGH